MIRNPNPYRAAIGPHTPGQSPLCPALSHPFRRDFFEQWDALRAEMLQDTEEEPTALPPGRARWFYWRGASYSLTEGDAASVCDAWAFGTVMTREEGPGPARLKMVDDVLAAIDARPYNPSRP